jgi:SAM-dependent methyltransferase
MLKDQTTRERYKTFFEELWRKGDPWGLDTSTFESAKYARQMKLLGAERFGRVLEIGCGAGAFTALLARQAGHVTAIDVSPTAVSMAKRRFGVSNLIEVREANIMDRQQVHGTGPWDLIVMSETIYYLGWLYPFFDVAWLASELFRSTMQNGLFLMANTHGEFGDYLVCPWIIRTYRDLFINVGYHLEHEENFRGTKNNVELDVLISLFRKPADPTSEPYHIVHSDPQASETIL